MSDEFKFDAGVYIEALPTFKAWPEHFRNDLRDILRGSVMKAALAIFEEQALLHEKKFVEIDFTDPDAWKRGMELKEKINALRTITPMLIEIANGDFNDSRGNDRDSN